MNYSNLMEAVNARIKANGRREITGDILNDVLRAMVVELGAGYQLGGTIRPGDKPKDEDLRVAYLAVEPGIYLYAGGFEVTELSLITYGAEWYMYPLGVPFGSQIAEDIAAAVEAEKTRAMAAEKALSDEIDTERGERVAADSSLDSAIKAETKRATDAEGVLTKAVDDEKTRAMAAEGANAAAIASEEDSREQADTALQGNITAEKTAREAADEALAAKVTAEEAARKASDATLQANINTEESERKAADTALGTRVTNIEDKIPTQATAENKLADKDFVNSSIATSTATFRGTFDTLEALKAAQADKNDYAFWVHKDEDGNTCYDKYTYTGTEWKFEYRLNNSSFTAAQWAALNSGVTADVIKALQDADKANAKAIADEKAERIASVAAETTAREQADTANAEAITTETAERKASDQALQANINKKVSKDDGTWLENFMPRIMLNGDGTTSAPNVGDNLVVDYENTSYYLGKYGGVVTPFDNESVHGRVVQVKDLNDNKLYVTAIFNNGADFSDNYANSLYEIILNFAANGSFANGTYTVKQMPEIFYFDFYSSGDGYETLTNWKDIVAAHSRGALILGRDEDGAICIPYTYYGDETYFNTILSQGPYDDGVITNIEFSWSAAYPNGAVNVYTYNWFDKQDARVSGTNIKTINGESVLGSGNLKAGLPTIQAGTGTNSEVFNGIAPESASGEYSHVEGQDSEASGYAAHAEGFSTISAGNSSHAEGNSTEANGDESHAEGGGSVANGAYSHAEGENTVAMRQASHAEGVLNVEDDAAIHQVGIGASAVNKDAHRITYDGKHYILGIGGFDGTKATANFTNEKDLATVINEYETRIAALETALAGIKSN